MQGLGLGSWGGEQKIHRHADVPIPVRFEKLAQDRRKQLEILQLAQAQGLDPPSHHFELKTFQTVRYQGLGKQGLQAGRGRRLGAQARDFCPFSEACQA